MARMAATVRGAIRCRLSSSVPSTSLATIWMCWGCWPVCRSMRTPLAAWATRRLMLRLRAPCFVGGRKAIAVAVGSRSGSSGMLTRKKKTRQAREEGAKAALAAALFAPAPAPASALNTARRGMCLLGRVDPLLLLQLLLLQPACLLCMCVGVHSSGVIDQGND